MWINLKLTYNQLVTLANIIMNSTPPEKIAEAHQQLCILHKNMFNILERDKKNFTPTKKIRTIKTQLNLNLLRSLKYTNIDESLYIENLIRLFIF